MKAEAYLIHNEKISFTHSGFSFAGDKDFVGQVTVEMGKSKVCVKDVSSTLSSDSKLCEILKRFLESHKPISLEIVFKYRREPRPQLQVQINSYGEQLRDLLTVLGSGLKFQLEISEAMTNVPSPSGNFEVINSTEMGLGFTTVVMETETPIYYFEDCVEFPKRWLEVFGIPRISYSAVISLKVCGDLVLETRLADWKQFFANLCALQSNSRRDEVLFTARSLVEDQVQPDVIIVVDNGALSLACHKDILRVHSEVLIDMACQNNSGTSASGEGKIDMLDVSSKAGMALQHFLYGWNLERVDDFGTVLELLECADKYSIGTLGGSVQELLMLQGEQWLDMSNSMNLFFFTRKIYKYPELQRKAVEMMKRNKTALMASPEYKHLCMKDPLAFMQLCNAIILAED